MSKILKIGFDFLHCGLSSNIFAKDTRDQGLSSAMLTLYVLSDQTTVCLILTHQDHDQKPSPSWYQPNTIISLDKYLNLANSFSGYIITSVQDRDFETFSHTSVRAAGDWIELDLIRPGSVEAIGIANYCCELGFQLNIKHLYFFHKNSRNVKGQLGGGLLFSSILNLFQVESWRFCWYQ